MAVVAAAVLAVAVAAVVVPAVSESHRYLMKTPARRRKGTTSWLQWLLHDYPRPRAPLCSYTRCPPTGERRHRGPLYHIQTVGKMLIAL